MSVVPVSMVPKGIGAARYAKCLLRAKGDNLQAHAMAREYRDTAWIAEAMHKSIVAPTTTTDGAALAPTLIADDFVPLQRTQEVLQRVSGFRTAPFDTSIARITAGVTASWHAEGTPAPLTKASFDTLPPLPPRYIIVDVPVTDELLRNSRPSAERTLLFEMLAAAGFASDLVFLNRLNAGNAAQPASIANGGLLVASTGNTATQIANDIATAVGAMAANGANFVAPYLCANPVLLAKLALKRTTTGAAAFPDLTIKGGSICGIPALPTAGLTMQSGDASDICIFDAALIELADEGQMGLQVATQASVQLSNSPDDPPTASTVFTSLWQENLAVLRIMKVRSWQRTSAGAVATITNVPS